MTLADSDEGTIDLYSLDADDLTLFLKHLKQHSLAF